MKQLLKVPVRASGKLQQSRHRALLSRLPQARISFGVLQGVPAVADGVIPPILQEQGVDGIDVVLNSLSALPGGISMYLYEIYTRMQRSFVLLSL